MTLPRDRWGAALEKATPPTFGEVVQVLEESDVVDGDPVDLVETALADGVLTEDDDRDGYAHIHLSGEGAERDENGGWRGDSEGKNPTPEGPKTGFGTPADGVSWGDADFTETTPGTYPPELLEREKWMGRAGESGKLPFAPWADRDHPEADADEDARWKWGLEENYVDGETVALAEDDPRIDGRVFIQHEDDPYAFVDGDDVRDPETGEVHPAFRAILTHLGATYADVSTSGTGVHAYYRGDLPIQGQGQAAFDIDTEPWGANDDPPTVELYANKHVNVATGDHIAGTGAEVAAWDDDALATVLRANGYEERPDPSADASIDLEDHTPSATASDETTDDIRDIIAALDRLDARRVADEMIVYRWNDSASTSGGNRAFVPEWGRNANGTANIVNSEIWQDTGGSGYGGVDVIAAVACPDLPSYDERTQPRDLEGADWFRAVEYLRERGYDVPELEDTDSGEAYDDDPRDVSATVNPRRAWDAAGRVTPDEVDSDPLEAAREDREAFACPDCGEPVDVVRAVAIAEGLVETCDAPLDDAYPEAYRLAREAYDAPLPRYYTTGDAIAEFDAVLDVIGEVQYDALDADAIATETTATDDEVSGDAVRAMNPAWRDSDTEASVLVFDSGTVWDADTERSLDMLRFVALDSGLIDSPEQPLEGELFTTAYRRARERYGAPLPRWEPALDGERDVTPMLPPADELLSNARPEGVDGDALDAARREVEQLIGDAAGDDGAPTVVTSLPATGKTTGTIKTARNRPLSYLAPRKELQAQALEKADRWDVNARVLPVFSEERVRDEVLSGAVSHVRELGKDRLRDRWSVLSAGVDDAEEVTDPADIFVEPDDDGDDVELDRPTCDTAEGDHGVAWALAVHVARRLGYTPREIHTQAQGLFGAELPCCGGDETDAEVCSYTAGWNDVSDPDEPADLLVGSYVHAHVESVRTHYSRDASGAVDRQPRALVLDEYPGEAFVREFDEKALDFATWLARSLREDIADRRDMLQADLWGDEFVMAWLAGEGDEFGAVSDATDTLARKIDHLEARENAAEVRREVDTDLLDTFGFAEPLADLVDGGAAVEAFRELSAAVDAVNREHPAAGIAGWVSDAVVDTLDTATEGGTVEPTAQVDTDGLPVAGELLELVEEATDAAASGAKGAHGRLQAAVTALSGGPDGCRRLAAWANDGYAHPNAHHLLRAVATPTEGDDAEGRRVSTASWAFDPDATEGTVLDVVDTAGRARTVLDRNDHGALLQTPPSRTAGDGSDVPVIGLDATGRAELWENALREEVTTADIHDTPAERAAFLENNLDLRVLQASDRPRPYEGDPASKGTDGDVALLQAIADEYGGIEAPRKRGETPAPVGSPAAITTKGVRELLESDPRLDDVVSAWENFGNVTGANDLGGHRLAAILGSQHYGDDAVERFAALAGQEVDTSRDAGRGAELDYGNALANAYLAHMREDQVMQAALRFARGDSGATVVARTSALRDDLPVVGSAQVAHTWSDTATEIVRQYRRLGGEFTVGDVVDAVDVGKRQVRRVLAELVDAGYLERVSAGDGVASVYSRHTDPSAGEVELPDRVDAVDASQPGRSASNQYYTWNVRVRGGGEGYTPHDSPGEIRSHGAPPAPGTVPGGGPPG